MEQKQKKQLVKISAIVLVAVLIALPLLQITGIVNILPVDYHTGLTLNTNTDTYTATGRFDMDGDVLVRGKNIELNPETKYVTAWQEGENSNKILLTGNAELNGMFEGFPLPYTHLLLGDYWWVVDYVHPDGSITNIANADTYDRNYISMASDSPSTFAKQHFPNVGYYSHDDLAGTWHTWLAPDLGLEQLITSTVAFYIKGPRVGGLRVSLACDYAELDSWIGGAQWHLSSTLLQDDAFYLISGEGEVTIESTNAIRSEGTETAEGTGTVYTKYVYEEGGVVTFSVDALYSGVTQGGVEAGNGWKLKLYGNGALMQMWSIGEDVQGVKISYTIPMGSFIPGSENEWRIELWNIMFVQSEKRIFVVDAYENMPGQTTVVTAKDEYTQQDTVYVTVSADANPLGTGDISYFRCWGIYGTSGINYAFGPTNYYSPTKNGNTYSTTFSFVPSVGDKWITILGFATDSDGRHGPEGTKVIHILQSLPKYTVTITALDATDASPLSGVQVTFGDVKQNTLSNGQTVFTVEQGNYDITLYKDKYQTLTDTAWINSDKSLQYSMVYTGVPTPPPDEIDWIPIVGLVAAIAIVGVGIYIYYMERRKK